MTVTPVRIAGTPTTAAETIDVRNPYGGAVVGQVPLCGPDEVDAACRSAAAALARGDFPQYQRARVLEVAADLARSRVEDFARTITMESGKPIRTARQERPRAASTR